MTCQPHPKRLAACNSCHVQVCVNPKESHVLIGHKRCSGTLGDNWWPKKMDGPVLWLDVYWAVWWTPTRWNVSVVTSMLGDILFFSCLCLDKPFSYCTKSYKGELQSVTLTSTTTSVPFYQKLRIRISLQLPHVTSGNLASTLSKMWAANKTVVLSFACFCSDGVEDYLSLLG